MTRNIMIILTMLLSTLGPSLVIAVVGYAAIRALGRNPAASPRILISMILAFIFAEAIAIIALLVTFNIFK